MNACPERSPPSTGRPSSGATALRRHSGVPVEPPHRPSWPAHRGGVLRPRFQPDGRRVARFSAARTWLLFDNDPLVTIERNDLADLGNLATAESDLLGKVCLVQHDFIGGHAAPLSKRDQKFGLILPRVTPILRVEAARRDRGMCRLNRSGFHAGCGVPRVRWSRVSRPEAAWLLMLISFSLPD